VINKIYVKTKKFIKENYKAILFLIGFYLFMNVRLPYYIWLAGGTINLDAEERIIIDQEYEDEGSFNLAYVTEISATIPTFLLSYIIPDWDLVPIQDYQYEQDETLDELYLRSKIDMEQANQAAVSVAYTSANKDFEVTDTTYFIYYVDPRANKNIKVGDELLSINGVEISENLGVENVLNGKKAGDNVIVQVKRNDKVYDYETEVFEENSELFVGVMVSTIFKYNTTPNIQLNFKSSESGPSGGLTLALSIYNKLVEEDITNGLKIVGTGTIDIDGNVGEIGGIKYKLIGAVKDGADVFVVPNGINYEDYEKLKAKKGYDIEIIGVSSFQETLEKLERIED